MDFEGEEIPAIEQALLIYRVIAWATGILLVILMVVGLPLKYLAGNGSVVMWTGLPHGWLYMGLLIAAYNLGHKVGWPWLRLGLIALGGTVPFASFFAEHYATKDVRGRIFAVREAGGWVPASDAQAPSAAVVTENDDTPATPETRIDPA